MKKRHERRRRTRKARVEQRGGALDSIQAWIGAVKNSEMYKKESDRSKADLDRQEVELRLGAYHFNDLKDDSLHFTKKEPSQAIEQVDPSYNINNNDSGAEALDIRILGATLALKWMPLTSGNPTPAEFKGYIEKYLTPGDMDGDADLREAATYLVTVENKLRQGEVEISSLTDESKYPLLVWSLLMNAEGEEAPTLVPLKQVTEELASQGLSDKAQPAQAEQES